MGWRIFNNCFFKDSSSNSAVKAMGQKENEIKIDIVEQRKEANSCLAIGAGVGTVGAVSAATLGVVCPLCYIFAPGFIGLGAYKRWKLSKAMKESGGDEK
jgi:hypothetical protein